AYNRTVTCPADTAQSTPSQPAQAGFVAVAASLVAQSRIPTSAASSAPTFRIPHSAFRIHTAVAARIRRGESAA
ncbi:MAG: hypothetical protein M3Z04_10205, partial [Chloroflexota bacterium]|nr:hypothetical protein [Chloroflexota bacterium]